jgi:hypothetical protein
MGAYVESMTTNWFTVSDIAKLHTLIGMVDCDAMSAGNELKVHTKDGKVRLTMYDCLNTQLSYWDEDEEEDIDLVESLVAMLVEGAVLRVTSVSWYKGELARFMYDVYTADGRSYSMNTMDVESAAAQELGVPESALQSR